jgi:hypothetical protein
VVDIMMQGVTDGERVAKRGVVGVERRKGTMGRPYIPMEL